MAPDSLVGSVLGERYELMERIGRGGTAVVYRGLDHRLGRTVAVKIIHDTLVGDEDYTRRFDREARAAAALSHPNIVAIFDRGLAGERPYIVMEYVRGQSLRQIIAHQAPLAPLVALSYVDAIARALAAAHEAGLMHRDIKPENVLITSGGQVKVTDFGLAKASQSSGESATHSVLMGTLSYLAPEIMTVGAATFASDIYSTGIVLYELLTGQKPHTGDEAANVLYKHVNVDVPPPSEALNGPAKGRIPDYLDALVAACCSREPALRPPDGRALERDIAQVRRRLVQGVASDPGLAARLRSRQARAEHTTVLVPGSGPSPLTESVTATLPVPVNLTEPDGDWDYADGTGPAATGGVTEGSGPVVVPARPLVQIKREPMYVRRRIGLALLLTIVVLGLVGAGVGGWWWRVGRWTEQPAVLGFDATDARSLLVGQGFQVAADTYAYSEDMGAGLVLSSDPGDGARIIKGGTVSLTISKGPERYTMPTIVGLTQADAAKALADCGAAADEAAEKCPKIGEATGTWDDTVAEGLIVWQSQEPGASLVPGTVVNISYSKGPEPVEVPDYTGQSAADAQAALEALQFVVSVTEEHSADVAEGLVISQTPNSGTGKHGDTIALVQSLGPVMVAVPNVATAFPVTTEDSAKAQITAAGLIPVVEADGGYIVLHIVRGQDPKPGTMVPQGSTVTITVV